MGIAGDLIAKAQDWPGAEELADRLRKTIPPHLLSEKERAEMGEQGQNTQALMQQAAAMQEEMAKAQERLKQLEMENHTLSVRAEIEAEKLKIDEFKAETYRIKVLMEAAAKDEQFNIQKATAAAQMENDVHDRDLREREVNSAQKNSTPSSE
jgi:DNA-binding protein YbaB